MRKIEIIIQSVGEEIRKWIVPLLCVTALVTVSCDNLKAETKESTTLSAHESVCASESVTAPLAASDTVVYITDTGEKYHRGSCYHLQKSKTEISRSEAKRLGYTACKNCGPPN